ncbi:Peptidase, M48 family [Desulfonema magnum]|uniref:Peptidase, M48 family n=2 Tax=Desulfonema magnum TaxID=45655 RepID=A0A975BIG4_9BACT|nr:Peptidase, M48 family [Desulfonema magnum]
MTSPGCFAETVKTISPQDKPEKLQKAAKMARGAGDIVASSTELDYDSEFAIGEKLALEGFRRYGLPVEDQAIQKYVNLVGNAVARNANRPGIPYHFVLVQSPLYNAFSCPGGIIFISSAMMKSMRDESQLAGVLAHEVSHVGHKHALQSVRGAKFFEGVDKITRVMMKDKQREKAFQEMIRSLQTILFDQGLDKNMEFEADLSGMEAAYRTGYDPAGFINVLSMLQIKKDTAQKSGSWFLTHPPLNVRIEKCRDKMKDYPDARDLARVKRRFLSYQRRL